MALQTFFYLGSDASAAGNFSLEDEDQEAASKKKTCKLFIRENIYDTGCLI